MTDLAADPAPSLVLLGNVQAHSFDGIVWSVSISVPSGGFTAPVNLRFTTREQPEGNIARIAIRFSEGDPITTAQPGSA